MVILGFIVYSAFCFWVVFMDGAEVLEGWEWLSLFDRFAASLTVRELRFSIGVSWLAALVILLFSHFGGT